VVFDLIISVLSVNLLHTYLLISQKTDRQETISEHAAKNRNTHLLYISGHFIGAFFFILFARKFFVINHHDDLIYGVAIFATIFECIQALVPARNKAEKYHEIFAYTMAAAVIVIGLLSAFMLPLSDLVRSVTITIAIIIPLLVLIALILGRRYFWIFQMTATILFHLEMLIVLIAAK
jgi:hypothetical protein